MGIYRSGQIMAITDQAPSMSIRPLAVKGKSDGDKDLRQRPQPGPHPFHTRQTPFLA
jgi:hypothetical protein